MDCSPIINARMSGVTAMRRLRAMHATDIYKMIHTTDTPHHAAKHMYQKIDFRTRSRPFSSTKTSIIDGNR